MGFPGVYGAMFPMVLYKASVSVAVIRETACSIFNLLLGRGWENPATRLAMEASDWLLSDAVGDHGVGFHVSDTLADEIRASLPVLHFGNISNELAKEEEFQCSVCLSNFMVDEEVRQTPRCSHVFHKDCLDKWLNHDQTTCPLCRSSLATDELLEKRMKMEQIDMDIPAELVLYLSSYHSAGGRGHWWQAYMYGIPEVIGGFH